MRAKILSITALAVAAAALPVASFAGGTRVGVSIGIGVPPVGFFPPPPVVYVPPAPVFVAPPPVFFPPPAVVYAPPVAVFPQPVFVARPAVVVRAGGFYGGPVHGRGWAGHRWH